MSATGSSAGVWKLVTAGVMGPSVLAVPVARAQTYSSSPYP